MPQTSKLFIDSGDQAVLLPDGFRFEGKEVFMRRDSVTGEVVLSQKGKTWDRLTAALAEGDIPEDFLKPEDREQGTQDRDPLAGMEE